MHSSIHTHTFKKKNPTWVRKREREREETNSDRHKRQVVYHICSNTPTPTLPTLLPVQRYVKVSLNGHWWA